MSLITRKIRHVHQGVSLEGYFACPQEPSSFLPGILIAPAWAGCNEQAMERANILARAGYAAFAIDLYGEGQVGKTREECSNLMSAIASDRSLLLDRLLSTLETLKTQPEVDESRTAAIGYCFGGLCVLDLARGGASLRGVVSLHGIFSPPSGMPKPPIEAKILMLHGFEDPMATPEQGVALGRELTDRGADWQLHFYGSTLHAFTNPEANDRDFGTVYNPLTDERSWRLTQDFLIEVLK
jgi:dienelactone hydrolase